MCRRRELGFTLFELIVVVSIITTLMGLFTNRVLYYQEQAEKVAMEEVALTIQSALHMQFAQDATRSKLYDAPPYVQDNPMDMLQKRPKNYVGEFYDPTPESIAPGHWMFDLKSRDLIYLPDRTGHFTPGRDGNKWIRFHVLVRYDVVAGGQGGNRKQLVAALFEPTEPYHWFN
jgi:general secretion pathway protein G